MNQADDLTSKQTGLHSNGKEKLRVYGLAAMIVMNAILTLRAIFVSISPEIPLPYANHLMAQYGFWFILLFTKSSVKSFCKWSLLLIGGHWAAVMAGILLKPDMSDYLVRHLITYLFGDGLLFAVALVFYMLFLPKPSRQDSSL